MHAWLAPGAVVAGRYRIEGSLGAGGFGTVLRATQLALGREVALKVVSSPLGAASERFLDEARIAQRLEHPNTVRILDLGEVSPGIPFIVFELLRGETLADRLARGAPLPAWAALRITAQVLKSLMEAHGHGIVHRDIKPANLFLTSHPGEPVFAKVLDFGVAKQLARPGVPATAIRAPLAVAPTAPALTRADEVVGTPLYMSPEQARAEPVSPSSDLYALGLVLGEMVIGRPLVDPSLGAVRVAMVHAAHEALALPLQLDASPVAALVRRATEKSPARRYASASEMLAHVEQILATLSASTSAALTLPSTGSLAPAAMFAPTLAAPFTPRVERSEARPPARRTWPLVLGVSCAVGLAALAGAAVLWAQRADDRSSSRRELSDDDHATTRDPLEPPPLERELDLSRRGLAFKDSDELMRRLRKEGYDVEPITDIPPGAVDQQYFNVRKPPCGGTIIVSRYRDAATKAAFVRHMADYGLIVEDGERALYVQLTTIRHSPAIQQRCSRPVVRILSSPR